MSKKKAGTENKTVERKGLSKKIRFEVLKRDSFKCQYCGASAPDVLLQVDHIQPVAGGGHDDLWNLVTSCQPCNSGKSDKQLSDTSVISKSKRQLDELQSRREQIEMLMEWKSGLSDLNAETVDHLCALCTKHMMDDFSPSPQTKHKLAMLLHQHGFELVAECISICAAQYLRVDEEGDITRESAGVFLEKIGAVCTVKARNANNPEAEAIYILRGLLSSRLRKHKAMYYDHAKALSRLRECVEIGVSAEDLRTAINECRCWSQFMRLTGELIAEEQ